VVNTARGSVRSWYFRRKRTAYVDRLAGSVALGGGMDAATLVKAMPNLKSDDAAQLIDDCNRAMLLGEITTQKRAAMFLAQVGHESASLRFTEEISPKPHAKCRPYIGRTFMQITWKTNYAAFGRWCVSKNLLTDRDHFVDNPTELADDKWAWLGAVWYWTVARSTLNHVSDQSDVREATRLINGKKLHGLQERQDCYERCISLGDAILPARTTDWFDIASQDDLRSVVRDEVRSVEDAPVTNNDTKVTMRLGDRIIDMERKINNVQIKVGPIVDTLATMKTTLAAIKTKVKA
jgi:predicted chitinase